MSETPLPNNEAARSPTGEILDVRPPATETKPTDTTTTIPTETTKETPPSTDTTAPKEGETLLTDKKPEAVATKAPETYSFKAPEGHTLDAKLLETVTPIFKELGLSQEAAQRLIDLQIAREIESAKAPKATYDTLRSDWRKETTTHKDISDFVDKASGKTGMDGVKANVGRALAALGDTELATGFKAAMDLTGAGDNPFFVRTFNKLASFVVEGTAVRGNGPSLGGQRAPGARPPSTAAALYPNLPSATG
jgi:hypothetical protein